MKDFKDFTFEDFTSHSYAPKRNWEGHVAHAGVYKRVPSVPMVSHQTSNLADVL